VPGLFGHEFDRRSAVMAQGADQPCLAIPIECGAQYRVDSGCVAGLCPPDCNITSIHDRPSPVTSRPSPAVSAYLLAAWTPGVSLVVR
jgi:hypothetical protein